MNQSELYKELAKERKILNQLIDEALKNGSPICEAHEIIEQSKKVNDLVEVLQSELNQENNLER